MCTSSFVWIAQLYHSGVELQYPKNSETDPSSHNLVQVDNNDSVLEYSDHSAAWDSKHRLDNPIRVIGANYDGPF